MLTIKVPRSINIGSQGLCVPFDAMLGKGLAVAKAIVLVDLGHMVPMKVLNVSDKTVNIGRNNIIAHFVCLIMPFHVLMTAFCARM